MVVPLVLFITLVILLVCSAFTSASEIAFFSLSPNDVEELKKRNKTSDKLVLSLREEPDLLLSTLLIFNNLVNVSVVIVASRLLYFFIDENINETIKFLIDTVLITFVVLLFGENMPKIYASNNSLQFARGAAFTLNILQKLLYPFSWLLIKPTRRVKRLEKHGSASVSMDELSQAFELTSNEIKEDKEILEGIIKFGNINTVGAMTPRVDVVAISDTASFQEVIDLVINAGYSRIPVYQENIDEIRGILYVKDLLPYIDKPTFDWRTLIRKPFFVPQTKHINSLLEDFQQNKTHIAIVVDEFGGTSGIISLEDLLEEIVGNIYDEFDPNEDVEIEKLEDNLWRVNGTMELPFGDVVIDMGAPFRRATMVELVKEHCGVDFDQITDLEGAIAVAKEHKIKVEKKHKWGDIVALFFEEYCESKLIQPTFVLEHPVDISPLAKRDPNRSHMTQRFELFINGKEYANAFSELNDPIDQRARFEKQVADRKALDPETRAQVDYDYITALEYGLPPTGGLGFGVDRLVMFLTGCDSIRDVVLFPQMKKA